MDGELQSLLRGIDADPDQSLPRLMLADWFDEQGDPRAEAIRYAEAVHTRMPPPVPWIDPLDRDPRWAELAEPIERLWLAETRPPNESDEHSPEGFDDPPTLGLDRGVPVLLEIGIRGFLERGLDLLDDLPSLTGLRNTDFVSMWPIRKMSMQLGELLGSERLVPLRWLNFAHNRFGDPGGRLLARSRRLNGIERLTLSGNKLGSSGVATLVDSRSLVSLRRLELDGNPISEQGADALALSGLLDQLEWLDLSYTHIRSVGVARLLTTGTSSPLRVLRLSSTELSDEVLLELAEDRSLPNLEYLDLSKNEFSFRRLRRLLRSDLGERLRGLDLRGTVTDESHQRQLRQLGGERVLV